MPFCSERCRSIDRRRWLNEEYGMPYESSEESSEIEGQFDDEDS